MRQVGAEPASKLALLEETIVAVRALLGGGTVTLRGREVTVDGVRPVHPPAEVPPLVAGVVQPRSLELSGRVADGTIIAEGIGPDRIAAARAHIERGRAAGTRPGHELVVFAFLHVEDDPERAAATRDLLATHAAWLGVPPAALFTLIGPAAGVPERVEALRAAGAGTVVLRPIGQVRRALAALRR